MNFAAAKTEISTHAENSGRFYEVGTTDELAEALNQIMTDSGTEVGD